MGNYTTLNYFTTRKGSAPTAVDATKATDVSVPSVAPTTSPTTPSTAADIPSTFSSPVSAIASIPTASDALNALGPVSFNVAPPTLADTLKSVGTSALSVVSTVADRVGQAAQFAANVQSSAAFQSLVRQHHVYRMV